MDWKTEECVKLKWLRDLLLITFLDLNLKTCLCSFSYSSVRSFSPRSTTSFFFLENSRDFFNDRKMKENWKNLFSFICASRYISSQCLLAVAVFKLSSFKNRVETNYMQIKWITNSLSNEKTRTEICLSNGGRTVE